MIFGNMNMPLHLQEKSWLLYRHHNSSKLLADENMRSAVKEIHQKK